MTKDEIMSKRQYLDKLDIMEIFGCGEARAYAIIRSIKSVSDRAKIVGKVTVSDYEVWFNQGTKEGA